MSESRGGMAVEAKPRPGEGGYYRWAEPNSNITVCLKTETVDRLQTDALRGIVTSPRAGKEVGGILLGRTETNNAGGLTFIDDFVPFPCAHRNGPSYDLTAAETAGFEAMLEQGRTQWQQSVVGYYRSHNRDGLFLSPGDLRLIQRHFPAPDSVFLIIKTLPNRACTAGFFFWKDGSIQSEFTDSEAPLIPISLPAALLAPAPETLAPVPDDDLVAAMTGSTRRQTLRRRLVNGIAITGVAAAAAVAVIQYRSSQPVHPVHSTSARERTLVATGTAPSVTETPEPPSSPKPLEPLAKPLESKPATAKARPSAMLPSDPAADPIVSSPSPVPETADVVPRPSTVAVDPRAEKPPVAVAAPPLNPVPAPNPPETAITPAPTAATLAAGSVTPTAPPLPPATSPAIPPTGSPKNAAPPPSAESSASPSPSPPSPAYTRVGPQVIHQAPLALPRGVGPKLTPDVELDVEVAIDLKGKVTRARVVSTKGAAAGLLAIEALKAAQSYRFQPAQENGRNVASVMVLTFRFDQLPK